MLRSNAPADRPFLARGADHRDRARLEERPHALARGLALARLAHLDRLRRRGRRERQREHPGGDRALHREPALREHLEHAVVLAEDVRLELGDAVGARDRHQVLEEQRADPASLVLVGDGERHLGARRRRAVVDRVVAADADDALAVALDERRDQADVAHEVELGEAGELLGRQLLLRTEEAKMDRLDAQTAEVLSQPVLVVRPDGADQDRAAVAEDLLRRVVAGITGHRSWLVGRVGSRRLEHAKRRRHRRGRWPVVRTRGSTAASAGA